MPDYTKEFDRPEYYDHKIIAKETGEVIGTIRVKPTSILWKGKNIFGLLPEEILMSGVALCPEGRRIFPQLTVLENLKLGGYSRKDKSGLEESIERGFKLFPRLKERAWQKGGTLSGGEQQMLALARALMSDPELIMMDEPSLGLDPKSVLKVAHLIRQMASEGRTVLMVEQNVRLGMHLANDGIVMEGGRIRLSAPAKDIASDPEVASMYLGKTT